MKIIAKSGDLTSKELYDLTLAPSVQKMKDVVGQVIEVKAWVVYEDVNSKDETQEILSIVSPDGEIFATNSPTFKKDFSTMISFFNSFGEEVKGINVISGTSKAGREFITCTHAF